MENMTEISSSWRAYQGLLGEVVRFEQYFFAWRDGRLVGKYQTFKEAMRSLAREMLKMR
jgi:hypothetical protein